MHITSHGAVHLGDAFCNAIRRRSCTSRTTNTPKYRTRDRIQPRLATSTHRPIGRALCQPSVVFPPLPHGSSSPRQTPIGCITAYRASQVPRLVVDLQASARKGALNRHVVVQRMHLWNAPYFYACDLLPVTSHTPTSRGSHPVFYDDVTRVLTCHL